MYTHGLGRIWTRKSETKRISTGKFSTLTGYTFRQSRTRWSHIRDHRGWAYHVCIVDWAYQTRVKVHNYATYKLVSKKIQEKPSISKKDYYLLVLEAFFSLNVQERYEIPAYIVLSDFFKDYNSEEYSLYYLSYCVCPMRTLPKKCEVCNFL